MVNEGGHADENIGLDFVDEADVAIGAERLAATGAQHESAEAQPRMVRQPEGKMGGIGEEIDVFIIPLRASGEHQPTAADVEIVQIVLGVKKRHRIR